MPKGEMALLSAKFRYLKVYRGVKESLHWGMKYRKAANIPLQALPTTTARSPSIYYPLFPFFIATH